MLARTRRQMQRDGLTSCTVHPVLPPKSEYRLTELGSTLSDAFCGVWIGTDQNSARVDAARRAFGRQGSAR